MRHEYSVSCENGHSQTLDATELEELINSGNYSCDECDLDVELDSSITLECRICSDVFDVSTLEEARYTIEEDCQACDYRGFSDQSIHLPHSWYHYMNEYEWMRSGKDIKVLLRKNRKDYWEGLVHFCNAKEFVSIYNDGHIRCSNTGYFKVPAVCLTEAPFDAWGDFKERHGDFGFVFQKRDVIKAGGSPACYLSEKLIKSQNKYGGFDPTLKPFVNLLRIPSANPGKSKHDYLFERESRTPSNIYFKKTPVFGVILGEFTKKTPGWKQIMSAAMNYEEVYASSSESN